MEKILIALYLASIEYGVSYEVMYGIAKVESGLNPLAVNVEGKSYFPESVEEALSLIRGKRNYDLGLMQINSYWVRKFKLEPSHLLDVRFNARMGAWVLRYCMDRFGNTWQAIDCYHRGDSRARKWSNYTKKVCSNIYGNSLCVQNALY